MNFRKASLEKTVGRRCEGHNDGRFDRVPFLSAQSQIGTEQKRVSSH